MQIKITPDTGRIAGKVADAELVFDQAEGPLAGLRLIGFGIWERRGGNGYNVTFPARQYSVNGERRSFALLRPQSDTTQQEAIRSAILAAYDEWADGPRIGVSTMLHQAEQPQLPTPPATTYIATPAGPVCDRSFGTAADYGTRSDLETPAAVKDSTTTIDFQF